VDTRTKVLVQKAMSALRSDRTAFVIAHRLSTIRDADLILVMESALIVEQGMLLRCWLRAGLTRGCTRRSSRLRWRRSKRP
jgi:ABC-type transport system involved in Fe-S cluster assembly fused permease/ATPase subunit